jgi:capsular polysaccharide biosynthesis protein
MEWSDYRQALARGWWLIVVFGIAGLAVGVLLPKATVTPPQWLTTTSIGAPPSVDGGNTSPLPPGVTTEQIQFFAASDGVYAEAENLAHLNTPLSVLRSMVTVTGPTDQSGQPGVIQVTVQAPTQAESAALNVGYDNALQMAVASGAEAATGQPTYTGFKILETTEPDFAVPTGKTVTQKFSSRPVRAVAGLLIGLLLGTLMALARGLLDKRVNSAKRAQVALGYPVVAELPAASSDSSEAYRMLWLSVFREPLPEVAEQGDQWLEGADLTLDPGPWPGSEP